MEQSVIVAEYSDPDLAQRALALLQLGKIRAELDSPEPTLFFQHQMSGQITLSVAADQKEFAIDLLSSDETLAGGIQAGELTDDELTRQALEAENTESPVPALPVDIEAEQAEAIVAKRMTAEEIAEADAAALGLVLKFFAMFIPFDFFLIWGGASKSGPSKPLERWKKIAMLSVFLFACFLVAIILIF